VGAVALILEMILDTKAYLIDEVITFGQPKVTNFSGSLKFSHLNITRIVTPNDVIPLLPPVDPVDLVKLDLSIFWPQGREIILYENKQYTEIRGLKSLLRASKFFTTTPSPKNLSSHNLRTYIKRLRTMTKQVHKIKYNNTFSVTDLFRLFTPSKPANK
jgi:hypothetical protein